MDRPHVLIFHRPAAAHDTPLVRVLADTRHELASRQAALLERAGARPAQFVTEWHAGHTFGQVLAALAPARGGLIVFGSGAAARLTANDARALVEAAGAEARQALTNNRYSSDICAISQSVTLRRLPPLPSDNALPRWLEERAGYRVEEMRGRDRLALDLDTPLDIGIAALAPGAAAWLRRAAADAELSVPRIEGLRRIAADARAELLVFGRAGSRTLRWLERNVRCRVRFLAEERGLRAASPLAIAAPDRARRLRPCQPRATLGMLLDEAGPSTLADVIGKLADAAVVDSRVLLAHRLGADEARWPMPADRFASDLLRPDDVADRWLRELTVAAAESQVPILLGSHTLVGPGLPIILAGLRR
ncbi:hypothetical protein BH20ACT17_BH20ACT17_19910 [soil metagenome]